MGMSHGENSFRHRDLWRKDSNGLPEYKLIPLCFLEEPRRTWKDGEVLEVCEVWEQVCFIWEEWEAAGFYQQEVMTSLLYWHLPVGRWSPRPPGLTPVGQQRFCLRGNQRLERGRNINTKNMAHIDLLWEMKKEPFKVEIQDFQELKEIEFFELT